MYLGKTREIHTCLPGGEMAANPINPITSALQADFNPITGGTATRSTRSPRWVVWVWAFLVLGCSDSNSKPVDASKPAQVRSLCSKVADDVSCSPPSTDGFTISWEISESECRDTGAAAWEACGLSHDDVITCVDELRTCDLERNCQSEEGNAYFQCLMAPCQQLFDCVNGTLNNDDVDMGDDADMGSEPDLPPTSFNPQFLQVASVLRNNCLLGGCHGNPPGAASVLTVPTGLNATDAEIQMALESTTRAPSGNLLIAPGDPSSSELFLQMRHAGDATDDSVQVVEDWINAGADFTL